MIKIQIASDLHLDQMKMYKKEKLIYPEGDVLILSGDICHISEIEKHKSFFQYLDENFQYIIYVPGNHEFYNDEGISIEDSEKNIRIFLGKNFKNFIYLNNESIIIETFLITGSCLWYTPEKLPTWFRIKISEEEVSSMNRESINYIKSLRDKMKGYSSYTHIVATHYPPPSTGIGLEPSMWISGHTHENFSIFKEEGTLCISNQRKGINYSNSVVVNLKG